MLFVSFVWYLVDCKCGGCLVPGKVMPQSYHYDSNCSAPTKGDYIWEALTWCLGIYDFEMHTLPKLNPQP